MAPYLIKAGEQTAYCVCRGSPIFLSLPNRLGEGMSKKNYLKNKHAFLRKKETG
jgi:hypothetical protein